MMHSDIVGGSTAGRVLACPGSVALSADIPRTSSVYADEGTLLHKAIEAMLLDQDPQAEPDHMTDALMPAHAQWREFCGEYGVQEYDTEQRVDLAPIPGAFGSVDVIASTETHNVIWDWKFGRGVPVDADGNEQLMFYAAAAMHTPALSDLFDAGKPTLAVICQPRVRGELSIAEFTTVQLLEFTSNLQRAVRQAQQPHPPLKTGPHCRWCPAKAVCPAKRDLALGPKPVDIAEALRLAVEMEDWARGVFAAAELQLLQGGTIPGWGLEPKRPTRKWVDETVAEETLRKLKYRLRDITETRLKSPAQMAKVVDLAHLENLIESKSSGMKLCSKSQN